MLVSDKDALARLSSSQNLINRMKSGLSQASASKPRFKSNTSLDIFKPASRSHLAVAGPAPVVDEILDNVDSKIKLVLAHDKAVSILTSALDTLAIKMDDIKPEKLPAVISAASKMVNDIRKERIDANRAKADQNVHLHFYSPEQRKVEEYEVIDVG